MAFTNLMALLNEGRHPALAPIIGSDLSLTDEHLAVRERWPGVSLTQTHCALTVWTFAPNLCCTLHLTCPVALQYKNKHA